MWTNVKLRHITVIQTLSVATPLDHSPALVLKDTLEVAWNVLVRLRLRILLPFLYFRLQMLTLYLKKLIGSAIFPY